MKNILFYILGMFILFSCERDETIIKIKGDPAEPSITSHANGFTKVITKDNLAEQLAFTWETADYGVNTPVTYFVEIDFAGNAFAKPAVVGTSQSTDLTIKVEDFNAILLSQLKASPNEESALELRVVATLNEEQPQSSDVVNITIKTYKSAAKLWVPGGYQGWNPGAAPVIYETSPNKFEGYVYIQEGTGFKFTSAPDWDHFNYGDSGQPGILTTDGNANGMSAPVAGYYRFKVDTENLTYNMYRVDSFGLIGTATPGVWDNSTPMDYNSVTGVWSKTTDLVPGALKFRANNGWELNYGTTTSNAFTGTLVHVDDAITISEAGNYTITIDLRRANDDHVYTYSVVKN